MSGGTMGAVPELNLTFTHVPTGFYVVFPAFLENLSDQFESVWTAEHVYGRMDPITTFQTTRRSISVSWNVPADSFNDARSNLEKINRLMSFLYPLYSAKDGAKGATAINQGPLMRVQFGNLLRNATTGGGLLGYLNGFTMDPRLENGMFYAQSQGTAPGVDIEYYPKTMLLNCELDVLHEHELGFVQQGNNFKFRNKELPPLNPGNGSGNDSFPYYASRFDINRGDRGSRIIEVTGPDGVTRLNRIPPPPTERPNRIINRFGPTGAPGSKPEGIE